MNQDAKSPGAEAPSPPKGTPRSGEGADTALEALIRKRRQQGGERNDDEAGNPPDPGPHGIDSRG